MRSAGELRRKELTDAIVARFTPKYNKNVSGCWEWTAGKYRKGYGQFVLARDGYGQQRHVYAHRVAYVLAHGDIPTGAIVMHSCDNRACVNPAHLSLGTQSQNLRDASARGRLPKSNPGIQKITDAQVREIRQSTEKSVRLAERFGVTKSCMSQVRHGLRRKAA